MQSYRKNSLGCVGTTYIFVFLCLLAMAIPTLFPGSRECEEGSYIPSYMEDKYRQLGYEVQDSSDPQAIYVFKCYDKEELNKTRTIAAASASYTTTSVPTQARWSTSTPRPTTVQTMEPSAIPTITPKNELVSIVTNGGNLRTEPKTMPNTVIGQVCPGDEVTLLEKDQIDSTPWYYVQLRKQSLDCDPNRVKVGTIGWISRSLLSKPSFSSSGN